MNNACGGGAHSSGPEQPGNRTMIRRQTAALALLAALTVGSVYAEEWTSWRGPHQNGTSSQTGLIDTWNPEGENLIWRRDFIGRSTPVVMGGRVFVNGRDGTGVDQQAVIAAFDAGTGVPVWERRYNLYLTTVPMNRVGWASLTGDPETGYIYAQLVSGFFLCLDRDGNTVWSRSLKEEHGRFEGYGGRTASAVIHEDQVILNMINGSWGNQGAPRHRYYAFDKRSGAVRWMSTPGGTVYDRNTQSVPVLATIDGQRLVIGGNADGHIYALQARTGRKVWEFELSKRGINVSPVVDDAGRVFVSHSEENVDEATLGRVVAIDGTASGDITATGELWRWNRNKAGFPSPALHEGRLYIVSNQGNLAAVDAATGDVHWELSIGTVGKASPVWADGKLFAPETNGHFAIVRPGDDSAEILARHELKMPDGRRYAEFYGSPAVAYGRIYFTTEEGLYCLGDKDAPFEVASSDPPSLGDEGSAEGQPASLLVNPAEVTAGPGETHDFEVEAFDASGRSLGPVRVTWSLRDSHAYGGTDRTFRLSGDARAEDDNVRDASVTFPDGPVFATGALVARVGDIEAEARFRIFPPLPWGEDFSGGKSGLWIGGGRYDVTEENGDSILIKPVAERGLLRSPLLLGPPSLGDYTIQADVRLSQKGRRKSDAGMINSGYILDLLGIHQRLQIRSWSAQLRVESAADFEVEMDHWYTMKLQVESDDDEARIRGKVWARGADEPADWTVTAVDPHPIRNGSPGLLGYSPSVVSYDNVLITPN